VAPRIDIEPDVALVDETVALRVTGLPAHQRVILRARMAGYLGTTWDAHATFVTDAMGSVDVSGQRPVSGTYDSHDPMGLFWSMALAAGAEIPGALFESIAPLRVRLEAEVNGALVASTDAERRFAGSGVIRTEVREYGMVGTLFRPASPGRHPAVLVVGGSSGDLWEVHAAILASRGFAALALGYFALPTLPPWLANIPLEYFQSAIHWLLRQDGIDSRSVAVLGGSRGGELALLLGATFSEIGAVVAYVPSGVLWEGMGPPDKRPPSWTLDGRAAPFLRRRDSAIDWTRQPIALTPSYLAALDDEAAVAQAEIPVERTRGPILLVSGRDDRMWPSAAMSEIAVNRLRQRGFEFPLEHLCYDGAGHLVVIPPYLPATVRHAHHPVAKRDFAFGGSPAAEAFARADSWPRVVAFRRRASAT
jgi:dienelactone hydrolase